MSKKVSEDIYDYKHRLKHDVANLVFKPCKCNICTKGPFVESPFYIFPDGEAHECPDFPNDLNECFRWLIPKIRVDWDEATFSDILEDWIDEYILHSPPSEPALHLCIAVLSYYEGFNAIQREFDNVNREV